MNNFVDFGMQLLQTSNNYMALLFYTSIPINLYK